MPIVNAKCTNCGSVVRVATSVAAAICPHCGSAYVVERAVNDYNAAHGAHPDGDFTINGGVLEKYSGASLSPAIPDTVKAIGTRAFAGRADLTGIVIPHSVVRIGDMAFAGCIGLKSVTIPCSVAELGYMAFAVCTGLTHAEISSGVIGASAFAGCNELENVVISEGVTGIGDKAFADCRSLTGVTIPDSVKDMTINAFDRCTGLTSVAFPANIPFQLKAYILKCTCSPAYEAFSRDCKERRVCRVCGEKLSIFGRCKHQDHNE